MGKNDKVETKTRSFVRLSNNKGNNKGRFTAYDVARYVPEDECIGPEPVSQRWLIGKNKRSHPEKDTTTAAMQQHFLSTGYDRQLRFKGESQQPAWSVCLSCLRLLHGGKYKQIGRRDRHNRKGKSKKASRSLVNSKNSMIASWSAWLTF